MNAEVVEAARPVVDERRLALYRERFKEIYTPQGEIEGRKVLQAAAALAAICLESKEGKASIAHMSQVCKDLGLDDYGRETLEDVFLRTGFLVEVVTDWELGIPSLGRFIISQAQALGLHPPAQA